MNIQEMISKMSPQMLSQGLKQISASLSPEQLAQVENAIKSMSGGDLSKELSKLNTEQLSKELQTNPALAKQLANNPELLSKLSSILKNK